MARHRNPYPPQFRGQIVELIKAGRTPEELACEFEPTAQTIYNWVRQAYRDTVMRHDGLSSSDAKNLRACAAGCAS